MAGGKSQRRVATVVFVDVVESTRVAAEVGDARWHELLRAFRATVRGQLKRYNGHEVDTAGDGFFAWFDSPANAIRAAVAICAETQQSGLDVRCGLHTGELEQIDGRLGGIAAHIGARVVAAAGPAEILATTTVRDLVVGGGVTFESVGEKELKGVPGTWALQRVTSLDGHKVASPLEPDEAGKRRSPPVAVVGGRRALGLTAVVAFLVVVALLVVSAYGIFGFGRTASATLSPTPLPNATPSVTATRPGDTSRPTSTASSSAAALASPNLPLSMVQVDPATNKVTGEIRDEHSMSGASGLLTFGGNLFQVYDPANKLVQRDLSTGAFIKQADLAGSGCCGGVQQGFGSIWRAYREPYALIDRIDPTSGQVTKTLDPKIQVSDFAVGDRAVYLLDHQGQVHEIDPINNQETVDFPSQAVTPRGEIWYANGKLYIPDGVPTDPGITVVDASTHEFLHRWTGLRPSGLDPGVGAVDASTGTLWLINPLENTVTPLEINADGPGFPTGLPSSPNDVAVGFGSIWVAAGQNVYRIGPTDHVVEKTIVLPDGANTGSIVMDTADGKIWVSNCHGPGC